MEAGRDVQELNHHYEFRRWRQWLQHYLQGKGLQHHLTSDETSGDEKFTRERGQVMALLFRSVSLKFTNLIEGKATPKSILQTLDENFNLNIFEEIETLEKKFDSLKFTPEAEKLFTYVRGLINQYRNLKGTLPEHQIARKIIDIFPDDLNYMPVKIALKQMAKMNGNKYDLDLVIRELEDVANA